MPKKLSEKAKIEQKLQIEENPIIGDDPVAAQAQQDARNSTNKRLEAAANQRVQDERERKDAKMDRNMRAAAEGKNMGGSMKIKYAEGSMLVPPEMEADQETPVDTYDNIPPDEMAAAEASQLPDEEMEDGYLEYVLDESLDQEDQEYLMSVLEGDERLSGIFDKVMDVAGEFSGEGEVDGPGTGVSDSIPARLSDGEFVVTEKATDQLGSDQLQIMMDDAERAFDGGYMKKAFGGMVDDIPTDDRKEDEEINSMMISSNQMPSVRPR